MGGPRVLVLDRANALDRVDEDREEGPDEDDEQDGEADLNPEEIECRQQEDADRDPGDRRDRSEDLECRKRVVLEALARPDREPERDG